jgi:hypothetical protein
VGSRFTDRKICRGYLAVGAEQAPGDGRERKNLWKRFGDKFSM